MGLKSLWQALREEDLVVRVQGSDGDAGQRDVASEVLSPHKLGVGVCSSGPCSGANGALLLMARQTGALAARRRGDIASSWALLSDFLQTTNIHYIPGSCLLVARHALGRVYCGRVSGESPSCRASPCL